MLEGDIDNLHVQLNSSKGGLDYVEEYAETNLGMIYPTSEHMSDPVTVEARFIDSEELSLSQKGTAAVAAEKNVSAAAKHLLAGPVASLKTQQHNR